jgi:hypothetical protein
MPTQRDSEPSSPVRSHVCRGFRRPAGFAPIDAAGFAFIDHRSLFDVADYAERHETTVVLRTRLTTPGRLLELFGLTGVRVEGVS